MYLGFGFSTRVAGISRNLAMTSRSPSQSSSDSSHKSFTTLYVILLAILANSSFPVIVGINSLIALAYFLLLSFLITTVVFLNSFVNTTFMFLKSFAISLNVFIFFIYFFILAFSFQSFVGEGFP